MQTAGRVSVLPPERPTKPTPKPDAAESRSGAERVVKATLKRNAGKRPVCPV